LSRLLLDSHVFLWFANANPMLSLDSIEMIRRSRDVYVSAASVWELTVKIAKGKMTESRSLVALAEAFGFILLPVQPLHAEAIRSLGELHHGDPFDHLLLAQAKIEDLTLMTHDMKLARYGVPVILV
jgi:PIN domain nuclease of toxin-antitoxin system